nr:hypothetical protein [Tanacetum cinerariifolium]
MRRAGKGCFRVETPLFEGMIVAPQAGEGAAKVNIDDVHADGVVNDDTASVADDVVPAAIDKPSIPLPTPPTQPPPSSQDSQDADISRDLLHNLLDICTTLTRRDDDIEPAELHEVVEMVTTTKLITKVVTAATATITAAALQLTTAAAPTLTNAPSATKRRKESSNKRS